MPTLHCARDAASERRPGALVAILIAYIAGLESAKVEPLYNDGTYQLQVWDLHPDREPGISNMLLGQLSSEM